MNRKIFFPLIVLITFFLFVCKTNALVPLCVYKEYNNDSDDAKTAYIYLGDSFIYANVSQDRNSFYYTMMNLVNSAGQAITVSAFGTLSMLETVVNSDFDSTQYSNQMLNNPDSKTYRFGNANRTGTVLNTDGTLSDRNIEINWDGNLKSKFSSGAVCPNYLINDGAFIFDSPSLEFRSDVGSVGVNNVVFELKSATFNRSVSEMSSELNSCITDSSKISMYSSLFDQSLFSSNAAERTKLNGYIQNNYGSVLIPIIQKKYSEGGECYNNNPSNQSEYSDMVSKVNNFVSIKGGGMGEQDVNTCDDIINGKFAQHLNSILKFIMYLGPILTIVLSSVDYFKAMISNDNDSMKKVNSKTIVRIIAALLLFMIPLIIRVLLSVFGFDSSCSMIN